MWDKDFSYEYYGKLLDCITAKFDTLLIRNADQMVDPVKFAFIRHDVDVDLIKAVDIARLDALRGIASTFYIRVSASGYDINTRNSRNAIDSILLMGHDIGLHYDSRNDESIPDALEKLVNAIGRRDVKSISMHIPQATDIRGAFRINGMINAYSKELMQNYISDSSMRWRCGDPMGYVSNPSIGCLQVAMHPIWWENEKIDPAARDQIVSELEAGK